MFVLTMSIGCFRENQVQILMALLALALARFKLVLTETTMSLLAQGLLFLPKLPLLL